MGYGAADRLYGRVLVWGPIIVFPFALIIFAFSGCEIRKRSEKAACRSGNVEKCLQVGKYYDDKQGGLIAFLMSHADTSMVYYLEACKLKSSTGCERLVYIFDHGEQAKNLSVPLTEIADALINACTERVSGGCAQLDTFMGARDWVAARSAGAFKQRCDAGNNEACYRLGKLHGHNLGGLHNIIEEVLPLYEKACAAQVENACELVQAYRAQQAKLAAQSRSKSAGSAP